MSIMSFQKTFFLFGILVICRLGIAQQGMPEVKNTNEKTLEIGTNVYSVNLTTGFYSYLPTKRITHYFIPGLYFRYVKSGNAFRTSFSFLQSSTNYNYSSGEAYGYNYNISRGAEVKLGYQRMLGKKRVSPYLCIDAAYSFTRSKGMYSSFGCFGYIGERRFLVEKSAIKINPGLGIRWQMKKSIVVTLETAIDFFYTRERDLLNGDFMHAGRGMGFSPVQQLSIGYMF